MKTVRSTAFSIVVLMLLSILASFSGVIAKDDANVSELADEPVEMEATSPGHPVFAEYMGAHWCPPCKTISANLNNLYGTNGGGGTQSEDFTYISFWESSSTGWPSDSPINRRSHIQNAPGYTGGIPVTVLGDAPSGTYYHVGGGAMDSKYTSGGNMKNTNDYSLTVLQSQNGNNMDIDITATYSGAGTKTVYFYAAVTEETSPETYDGGSPNPHHVWKKWLLNGANNGFESATLSSGSSVTKSWSVPVSTVRAGGGHTAVDNFLTVAALLDGDHTAHRNVVSAADSNMAPVIDVGVKSLTVDNPNAPHGGYINGDVLDLQATIINNGVDAYTDGGDVKFFYKSGNSKTYVGQTQSLSNFASNGATQSFSSQISTNSISTSAYQTSFGIEISNLVADRSSSNNEKIEIIPHDLVPVARKAQVIGSNQIERGDNFLIEAKTTFNDAVDINTSFFTFDVEVSPAGADQWMSGDLIVGGDEVFQEGTSNEHRQYLVKPDMNMGAGFYDIRVRSIDSRMQTSDWQVTDNGFELKNALPTITSEPVPTVKVQTSTKVSIISNINDAETALNQLEITSSSLDFIAWHPATEEIEVYFENIRYVNGQPMASGIEIAVNDGLETAYGTLLFNVIENGQPRWAGVEKQYVNEDSSASLFLSPYLSDTDSNGDIASTEDLVLAIIDNTNPDLLNIELNEYTINYETSDADINGETTITVRASDGEQFSDQMITIAVNPVNDAPRLDLSEFEGLRLKAGTQKVIMLNEIMTDVDGDISEVIVTASNPTPGAARVNFLDNTLTLLWEEEGYQTVTIVTEDRYDSNVYTLVVDVFDSVPMTVGTTDSDLIVSVSNVYIEEEPEVTMFLNMDDVTITALTTTWQLCNSLTGVCTMNVVIEHDITAKDVGWTFDPLDGQMDDVRNNGMLLKDYVTIAKVTAISSNGEKFEYKDSTLKWSAEEKAPGPETMEKDEVEELVEKLDEMISEKKSELEGLEEGTAEHDKASTELDELESDRTEACKYTTCEEETSGATDSSDSGLDTSVILAVIGIVIIALLVGLMFIRGGKGENDVLVDWANELPANDAIANSMFGGTQEIFQQPVAAVAPAVAPTVQPATQATYYSQDDVTTVGVSPVTGPPLPATGLPEGWTMEQWAYYGHRYQQ